MWRDAVRTKQKNIPPPHGIKLYKGAYQVVLARSFVDYVINNTIARNFLEWVKTTGIPDETYFNSLNRNQQLRVPGAPHNKGIKVRLHTAINRADFRFRCMLK